MFSGLLVSVFEMYLYFLPLLLLLLVGCQPKVYLMPPPIGLQSATVFFHLSEDSIDDNLLYTLYATNRIPYNKLDSSTGYTIFPSDTLEIGYVVHSIGEDNMDWDELHKQSLKEKRDKDLLIKQIFVREGAEYHKNDDINQTSSRAEGFFEQINKTIDSSFDKDLTVYVHGANANFYRATAQGAQFFHYTGHNATILTFSWPSAENILKYKTDVLHAKLTIPAFAQLIEILARQTNARNINVIAYSAGAQVVAPGLAYLRDLYSELPVADLKKRLRIGEVYFAAPDTAFQPFIERYLKFKDIVRRTTINLNTKDRVLGFSAFQNGLSRLGKPDISELSETEADTLIAVLATPELNVLDVGNSEGLDLGGSHDSWYSHPWVSNDLLTLLLFNAKPEDRGLVAHHEDSGAILYRFPLGYGQNIQQLMLEQEIVLKRNRTELTNSNLHKKSEQIQIQQ